MTRLRFLIPLVAALMFSSAQFADGEIVMTISDNGTDLTMRATGSYNFGGLQTVGSAALCCPAYIGPNYSGTNTGLFGWETEFGAGSIAYDVTFDGSLSGNASTRTTSVSTNTPFYFVDNPGIGYRQIVFSNGTDPNVTVDETAVFANTTLASLGMVAGETVNVFLGGPQDSGDQVPFATIQTTVVPEPSSMMMFGIAGLVAWRRRR